VKTAGFEVSIGTQSKCHCRIQETKLFVQKIAFECPNLNSPTYLRTRTANREPRPPTIGRAPMAENQGRAPPPPPTITRSGRGNPPSNSEFPLPLPLPFPFPSVEESLLKPDHYCDLFHSIQGQKRNQKRLKGKQMAARLHFCVQCHQPPSENG